jgi:hypothetical protein
MYDYLAATKRRDIGDFSREYAQELREDEINLSELEPHINGPFTPDLATPISKFKEAVKANKWPEELKVGLIGSCTNSSYEDMSRAASIAQDAMDHGVKAKSLFTVTPGSEQIRATIESEYLSIVEHLRRTLGTERLLTYHRGWTAQNLRGVRWYGPCQCLWVRTCSFYTSSLLRHPGVWSPFSHFTLYCLTTLTSLQTLYWLVFFRFASHATGIMFRIALVPDSTLPKPHQLVQFDSDGGPRLP